MKIIIEDFNEIGTDIEVYFFIDNGELQTVLIDRYALLKDIEDNDLNVYCEDKWDYKNEEHYTIDHVTPANEYLEDNMKDCILAHLYGKELIS